MSFVPVIPRLARVTFTEHMNPERLKRDFRDYTSPLGGHRAFDEWEFYMPPEGVYDVLLARRDPALPPAEFFDREELSAYFAALDADGDAALLFHWIACAQHSPHKFTGHYMSVSRHNERLWLGDAGHGHGKELYVPDAVFHPEDPNEHALIAMLHPIGKGLLSKATFAAFRRVS